VNNKIKIHKKTVIQSIAKVQSSKIKPRKIEVKKPQVIQQKPQSVVIQKPKLDLSRNYQERVTTKRVVEAVKKNRNSLVRLKKPKKDSNYHKIADIRNCGIGRFLVMIACGPSILENDFSILKEVETIDIMSINKPLKSIWPTKYWAFCDNSQYERNKSLFNQYGGTLINSNSIKQRKNNQILISPKLITGISRNLHDGYVIGKSSVYANIQTALWMNYDKIFIFGVDMCAVNGKLHYYGVNPDVKENIRLERFKKEADNYNIMASKLPDDIRKKIYFCSSYNTWPFVDKFNKWDHETALTKILEYAS